MLALPLMMKVLGKGDRKLGRGCMNKILVLTHPLSNIEINNYYFNSESRFNGVFSRNIYQEQTIQLMS